MRGNIWTAEDWATASKMLADGADRKDIALALSRTTTQLRQKIAWEKMTPAAREGKRQRINAWRQAKARQRPQITVRHKATSVLFEKAPKELFDERARRNAIEYRDLTGEFFGDPKPGYSALDQREQRA